MYTKRAIVAIKRREERVVVVLVVVVVVVTVAGAHSRIAIDFLSFRFSCGSSVCAHVEWYITFWSWLQPTAPICSLIMRCSYILQNWSQIRPKRALGRGMCVCEVCVASFNWILNGNLTCGTQSELIFSFFFANRNDTISCHIFSPSSRTVRTHTHTHEKRLRRKQNRSVCIRWWWPCIEYYAAFAMFGQLVLPQLCT